MSRLVAWSLFALAVALTGVELFLLYLTREVPTPPGMGVGGRKDVEAVFSLALLSAPFVGAIVASRYPANPVGWIFCAAGAVGPLLLGAGQYALYGLVVTPGAVPAADAVGWLGSWTWLPPTAVMGQLFLIFPDGRLPSPRWRLVVALLWGTTAALTVAYALQPGPIFGVLPAENPVGLRTLAEPLGAAVATLSFAFTLAILLSAAGLVARLRSAKGDEREQLKWIVYAAVVVAVAYFMAQPLAGVIGPDAYTIWGITFLLFPLAVGLAILKYRLYEIDLLINRTLVYGALSATLLGIYLAGVLLLQVVLRPVTGGSEIAVAVSTLVAAALFQPARRRIQDAVDRRFYRSKYDAARTLSEFSTRLRQQIDLDALSAEITFVVRETMRPRHVSLWLRGPERRRV